MDKSLTLVVPLSLGAAVSPALLTLAVLILSGKVAPKKRAWAYAGGVALVDAALVVLLATIGRNIHIGSSHPTTASRIVHGVIAAALVGLGVHALLRKHPTGSHPSRLQRRIGDARPRFFLGLGAAAMATNVTSIVLMVAAVHEVTRSDDTAGWVLRLAILFVCVLAPAALPVAAASVLGHRSDAALSGLNRFTTTHARQINAGICFVFAILLGIDALK